MDPVSLPPLPDPLGEPSPFAPLLRVVLTLLAAAVLIPALAFYFGLDDALIHPLAMRFGRPAVGIISSKWISTSRRFPGKFVDLNYQYSKDFAPRPRLEVNDAAYAALAVGGQVAMHYLPGCSSCVTLDNDYGSARVAEVEGVLLIVLFGAVAALQWSFAKFKSRSPASIDTGRS